MSERTIDGSGLQAERTILAHRRTDLAAIVVAVLLVRQAAPGVERLVVVVLAAASVAAIAAVGLVRHRNLVARPPHPAPSGMALIAAATVAMQTAALTIVL